MGAKGLGGHPSTTPGKASARSGGMIGRKANIDLIVIRAPPLGNQKLNPPQNRLSP
jgi:hypothetical protein